jgi:integrase
MKLANLRPAPRDAPQSGTFRWLCQLYLGSAEYRSLDDRTQRVRRQIIDHMCAEPLKPGSDKAFRDCPLDRFSAKHVRALRDRKMDLPEAANVRVKTIRVIFKWAMANDVRGLDGNPARDVPFLRPRRKCGFHSWTPEEVETFESVHPIGTKARLALALLLYTGARRSDAILLGRQHVRDGQLKFTAQKNKNRTPTTIDIPVLPALQAIIEASPTGDLTFLVTEFGKPFTRDGFGNWFRRQCRSAGLQLCSAHGLRKAGATIAAENGATTNQLMAIFGWATAKEAERYTKAAERKRLATDATRLLMRPDHEQKSLTLDPQTRQVREFRAKTEGLQRPS